MTFDVVSATSRRSEPFRSTDLLDEVDATLESVRRELAKLASLNVVIEAPDAGSKRDRPYKWGRSKLARRVRELPRLIEDELEGPEDDRGSLASD